LYNHTEIDRWELRQCVKLAREIFRQTAFDEFRGDELRPGVMVSYAMQIILEKIFWNLYSFQDMTKNLID